MVWVTRSILFPFSELVVPGHLGSHSTYACLSRVLLPMFCRTVPERTYAEPAVTPWPPPPTTSQHTRFTVTRVLIAYTWFHSAPPYLRPWQSVPHRLVYRSLSDASSRPLFILLTGFPVFQPGLCVALQWAKAIWNANNNIINSYEQFTSHLTEVFSTTADAFTPNVYTFWVPYMNLRALDIQAADGLSRSSKLVNGGPVCTVMSPGKLVPLPIPQRPWSHIRVDFVNDLPNSEEEIVSDRGPQFISHIRKTFFKLLGVSVNLSSGYHPQTNGQTERKVQELGRYLWSYCQEDQHSWSRFLPWAEYTQNSLRQDTAGMTPFQCVLSYQPPLFPWTGEPSNVPAVDHWFRTSQRVWDSAHHHLQRAVRRHKRFADARRVDAPQYHPGDLVWLSTRDLRVPATLTPPELELNPLLPKSWTSLPSTWSTRFWTHDIKEVALNIWLNGRSMDRKNDPGWPEMMFSILLSYSISIQNHPDCPAPRGRGRPRHRVRVSGAVPGGGGNVRHTTAT
ncbi:Transposon Tf2-11 polyprotein [Labeo rohita]|uniref:Transposon Tf2-11 polyprotein n=1 Tax=Labeo rohita TaxID=84645 RepID=A0ABQ8L126_LABRO|nr:Transposon Tf2-11 polyprotein [Labeo rohita]